MSYTLPLVFNIQTTIEMHMHKGAIWHFDHKKYPASSPCCEWHAQITSLSTCISVVVSESSTRASTQGNGMLRQAGWCYSVIFLIQVRIRLQHSCQSWTQQITPKIVILSRGYLHAHISYLDEECQCCLLLLTVDRDVFFTLSECKQKIQQVMF